MYTLQQEVGDKKAFSHLVTSSSYDFHLCKQSTLHTTCGKYIEAHACWMAYPVYSMTVVQSRCWLQVLGFCTLWFDKRLVWFNKNNRKFCPSKVVKIFVVSRRIVGPASTKTHKTFQKLPSVTRRKEKSTTMQSARCRLYFFTLNSGVSWLCCVYYKGKE